MTILKDLIGLKAKKKNDESQSQEVDSQFITISYFQRGFGDSKSSMGHPSSFAAGLMALYESYKEKCRAGDREQGLLKQPMVEEKNRIITEVERKETFLQIKQGEIEDLSKQQQTIDRQIAEVKINPAKFGVKADKRPKAQFYIGLVVLLPITAYLVVFYMSASYSAFFKEFSSDKLTAAIFDAQAFSKAAKDGMMEVIFVSTIPFAFMGLGYLIHMFQKGNAIVKTIGLFLVTFIFDAILAYQIEQKVYDFNRTLNSEEFDLYRAIQSVSFWGIIFAGFVVYIIWGLVFDFIMKEYDNLDRVQQYIRKLKEDRANLTQIRSDIESVKKTVTEEIVGLRGKVRELQAQIDGFVFPKQKYLLLHAKYVKGWIKAIIQEIALPRNEKDSLIHSCLEVEKNHLKKYRLGPEYAESVSYYTDLNND